MIANLPEFDYNRNNQIVITRNHALAGGRSNPMRKPNCHALWARNDKLFDAFVFVTFAVIRFGRNLPFGFATP